MQLSADGVDLRRTAARGRLFDETETPAFDALIEEPDSLSESSRALYAMLRDGGLDAANTFFRTDVRGLYDDVGLGGYIHAAGIDKNMRRLSLDARKLDQIPLLRFRVFTRTLALRPLCEAPPSARPEHDRQDTSPRPLRNPARDRPARGASRLRHLWRAQPRP